MSLSLATKGRAVNSALSMATAGVIYRKVPFLVIGPEGELELAGYVETTIDESKISFTDLDINIEFVKDDIELDSLFEMVLQVSSAIMSDLNIECIVILQSLELDGRIDIL